MTGHSGHIRERDLGKTVIIMAILAMYQYSAGQTKVVPPEPVVETRQTDSHPYSNPALIYGNSFGNLFQVFYRNNLFDKMIAFTSAETIQLCGRKQVIAFYKNSFRMDFTLGKLTRMYSDNGITYLIYSNSVAYGTRKKVIIQCRVENDSCKIILPALTKDVFHIGITIENTGR